MTTVSYVGAGIRAVNTNGNVTPTIPTGVADGDLLIAWAVCASSTRTYSAPAGWTNMTAIRDTSGSVGPGLFIAWKRYSTGDTDPLFTGVTSDAGSGVVAKCIAYRNADVTTGPTFGTIYNTAATTGTSAGPISGVAVSGDGRALAIAAWGNDYTTQPGTPAGWTSIVNDKSAGTAPVSYAADDRSIVATTSAAVTITGTPTAAATRVGVQLAISEGITNINGIKVGSTIAGLRVGSITPSAVYVGATKVWP